MKSIFDGSDLDGVVHPKEIKYLRHVRFWLRIVGSWPTRVFGEKTTTSMVFLTYFNFFLPALCAGLNIAFVINHFRKWTFFDMGQVYINTFLCTVYTGRQVLPLMTKYGDLMGQFINEVHLFHHKHKSDYAMKMHLYAHKFSCLFTIWIIVMMLWGYTLYNAIPLYNNWVAGGYGSHMPANFSYDYAIYYEVPFDYVQDLKVHIFLVLFDLYSGITCTISFCVNDLLLCLQMIHLWGHLKILIYNLENFPRPADLKGAPSRRVYEYYSEEELKDVSQRLRDIVDHHRLILRNMKNISETFGPTIAVYYMFHLLSNTVLLLEISTLDPKALLRYGPLALIVLQLQIQISAFFELLSSMTEKLIRAVYSLPWEVMDVKNRRVVQVILINCQEPLGLKAIGMVEVGMNTTVKVLKTTLSYFVILRTVAMKEA